MIELTLGWCQGAGGWRVYECVRKCARARMRERACVPVCGVIMWPRDVDGGGRPRGRKRVRE